MGYRPSRVIAYPHPYTQPTMCRLLHVEWRCKHKQNIWEYCRDATAPSRTPSVTERSKQPCEAFVAKYTLTPSGPTADEYRNFCCKFVCCLEAQADAFHQVRDLESALGITEKDSIPHVPSIFLNRQQKTLKEARKNLAALVKRHEQRCEALYYGLGVVQEGDTWRAPAEQLDSKAKKRQSRNSAKEPEGSPISEGSEGVSDKLSFEESKTDDSMAEARLEAKGTEVPGLDDLMVKAILESQIQHDDEKKSTPEAKVDSEAKGSGGVGAR